MQGATRAAAMVAAVGLVLVVAVGAATAQQAGPSPQYLKTYSDAQTAFNNGILDGKFGKAKQLFERAIEFDDRYPGPYRYLALIAKQEKQFETCLEHAFTAVKKNPESKNAPEVRKLHAECRDALNRPAFREEFGGGGAIAIITPDVEGAKVTLNGLTMGATPFIRAFAVGTVDVGVERKGYLAASAKADVLEGLVTDVIFELKVDPNAVKEDPGNGSGDGTDPSKVQGWVTLKVHPADAVIRFDGKTPTLDGEGRIRAKPGVHDVTAEAPGHVMWHRRVRVVGGQSRTVDIVLRNSAEQASYRKKGYLSLGVAAVFGIVGATFGVLELRAFEDAQDIWDNETQRPLGTPLSETSAVVPLQTRADLKDARDRGKRNALISSAAYGLAAAALGASIYYFVKERPAERAGFEAPLAIAPIIPGAGGNADAGSGVGAMVTYTGVMKW